MSAHTPGPWKARFSESGGYDCMTHAWWVMAGIRTVADLDLGSYGQPRCHFEFRSPEAEANARLIAAAPTLLDAARLSEQNYARTQHGNPELMGDDEHEAWTALRAAIAKAEGREQVEP